MRQEEDAEHYLQMGLQLRAEKRLKEAVDSLRIAVTTDPKSADSWHYLGVSYDNLGKESKAIPCYLEALTLGLTDKQLTTNCLLFLSSSLIKVKRIEEAGPYLERILVKELRTEFQRKLYKKLNTILSGSLP